MGYPRFLPVTPRHRGPFLIDIAGDELAVRRQSQGDREGTVAGKDPKLKALFGLHKPHQKRHELSLLGCDLHVRQGVLCGFLP
jgi:hypothetical protein